MVVVQLCARLALQRAYASCLRTMPFGPSVVLTRSAMAIAPTKEACGREGGLWQAKPDGRAGHGGHGGGPSHQAGILALLLHRSLCQHLQVQRGQPDQHRAAASANRPQSRIAAWRSAAHPGLVEHHRAG